MNARYIACDDRINWFVLVAFNTFSAHICLEMKWTRERKIFLLKSKLVMQEAICTDPVSAVKKNQALILIDITGSFLKRLYPLSFRFARLFKLLFSSMKYAISQYICIPKVIWFIQYTLPNN